MDQPKANLRLTRLHPNDLSWFMDLFLDPHTMRFISSVKSPLEIEQQFSNCLKSMQQQKTSYFYRLSLHDKPLGLLSILDSAVAAAPLELGIMLLPTARGKGFADPALARICLIAFEMLQAPAVLVCFHPENQGALQLNIRLGFQAAPAKLRKKTLLHCWYLPRNTDTLSALKNIAYCQTPSFKQGCSYAS